jgi:ABC-2 type transport system permease protein
MNSAADPLPVREATLTPVPNARPNALWELFLFRIRALWREPSAIFWIFVFPLLISIALGIAFRNQDLARINVAVADGPDADALAATLNRVTGLSAQQWSLGAAKEELRRGRAAVVVVPGAEIQFLTDPTQPDGRTARLMAEDAIERAKGRQDLVRITERTETSLGARYIDFLIPGLLGMGLMTSGVWGVGWAIVQMRTGKLLKRLVATPMRRSEYLLSFVLGRMLLALGEVVFFILFARILFDVRVFGSYAAFVVFSMLGALSFSGLSLFVASRAMNSETAGGLMNVATMPMTVLSGVFFSADRFPGWSQPIIKALPLTALNVGLRAVMIDGAPLSSLGSEIAVLAAWGVACFGLALKIFRWV